MRNFRRYLFISILILLSLAATSLAQLPDLGVEYPDYVGYVNDFADVIAPSHAENLTALCAELERKTTAQVAVVTMQSTYPLHVEPYAVNLFERWGIGQKGKDNGILILLAIEQRNVRIEVGYGLEGAVPDAEAGRIIRTQMIPSFRYDDYSTGLLKGTVAVVQAVAREYGVEIAAIGDLPRSVRPQQRNPAIPRCFGFLFFIILFLILSRLIRRGGGGLLPLLLLGAMGTRYTSYWSGGSRGGFGGGFGGGGFGGFGGGMSGGGGATGSW
jgi:uncharacterized protein